MSQATAMLAASMSRLAMKTVQTGSANTRSGNENSAKARAVQSTSTCTDDSTRHVTRNTRSLQSEIETCMVASQHTSSKHLQALLMRITCPPRFLHT